MNIKRLFTISGSIFLIFTIILIWFLLRPTILTHAASYTVCTIGPPTCDYSSVQSAVDAAGDGDIIKVATGTYTGTNNTGGHPQVVYIAKSITIQGGYTTSDWTTSDPIANPTTLDAQGGGRGLYITGNITPTIEGLRITGGDATVIGGGESGGGVFVDIAKVNIRNNQVFSNSATDGGGIFMWESDSATIKDNIISNNSAITYSGGLRSLDGDNITISGNTISSNSGDWGGGLDLRGNGIVFEGNTINNNTATNQGGGLVLSGDIIVIGNNISNNTGVGGGGGMVLGGGNPTLFNNIIANNQGELGGGVHAFWCNPTFSRNTFSKNSATYGGGMMVGDANATLNHNTFISNTAVFQGGGLVIGDGTLERNFFSANSGHDGGGIFLHASNATLTNNIIINNQADFGSGLAIGASSPSLLHNTIASNTGGDGRGIYLSSGTVTMTNTINVGNTVGIFAEAGSTATLDSTLWGSGTWANGTDWAGDGMVDTSKNIWGNPDFVDTVSGDYHIGPDSDAIDQGVDAGVKNDVDFHPRPYQEPDLGADEYWPPGALKFIYLPIILH